MRPAHAMFVVYVLASLADRGVVANDPFFVPVLVAAMAATVWQSLMAVSRRWAGPSAPNLDRRETSR
ncbi:hypothetical protein [Prauserella cavernicola]|uniref:Uncharacterized protein n=1 Tax=Prauserella cavernicola TaxID=2800127 RepID=A0A934V6U6_9PSEU|nr:hypothetical protein [Prauserella cavernicola]MBK1786043.1 hypothetical protein [Prauserella cavernicola]